MKLEKKTTEVLDFKSNGTYTVQVHGMCEPSYAATSETDLDARIRWKLINWSFR